MSSKVKRKVTVENAKESSDQQRRTSVFDRLGTSSLSLSSQSQDRHGRVDHNEKCRNWLRTGSCSYGSTCRFQHDPYPAGATAKRTSKASREIDKKDLRHKVQKQRDEPKESRTGSLSPKRKGPKRTGSRSRKGEHESKIKSTVVVTRPCSPPNEPLEKERMKGDGNWEEDSDDWPVDESQLDNKEEMTLERKRKQLQRKLAELQKEKISNENPSFSDSSSSSSSSDSGSLSSSSDTSSSSSDDDSDDSSSTSSSSSSSASQMPMKKKYKKQTGKKESSSKSVESSARKKPIDDYDKIKSSRISKSSSTRVPSPHSCDSLKRKEREKKIASPLPLASSKSRSSYDTSGKSSSHIRKGPRTPSPPPPNRKQRQWGQSSSADSRSADTRRNRNKKHKKKKDSSEHVPTPPRLSTPNRTVLQAHSQVGKKSWHKEDSGSKIHQRIKDHSPLLLSRLSNVPSDRHGNNSFYSDSDKPQEKHGKSKLLGRKSDDNFTKKDSSRDRAFKRSRLSPNGKDLRNNSNSPYHERYDIEQSGRKMYASQFSDKIEKNRRRSSSPVHHGKEIKDRKKSLPEMEKRREMRDLSPRNHDNRSSDIYGKKDDGRGKRALSPELKKGREDKTKERGLKERMLDQEAWDDDHKKSSFRVSDSRRIDTAVTQTLSSKSERSRDRERDHKKGKDREIPVIRDELDRDRLRLSSPMRSGSDIHSHHNLRDEPPVSVPRSHIYDSDLPPEERHYSYGYGPPHDAGYVDDRVLPPDYDDSDLLRAPSLYPPSDSADYPPVVYSETRYRRDGPLKDPTHLDRMVSYSGREVSPLEPVVLPVRDDDFLADLSLDERRAYDERWARSRPLRDEWDAYSTLPPSSLPPHVSASLDEDRYGMPRRRRASPDWHLRRGDNRDLSMREPRLRSPQHSRADDGPLPNRAPWRDQNERHNNRNDNRSSSQQKSQDERKNRNNRRDRRDRDRTKRNDDSPINITLKSPQLSKEKSSSKRSRSSTPSKKENKKRKEENTFSKDDILSEKALLNYSKKSRDDVKSETKSLNTKSNTRTNKNKSVSPKLDEKNSSKSSDKSDTTGKSGSKSSGRHEGDEKKKRNIEGKNHADDQFSDWSDGDDDLLNRDPMESESNNGEKSRLRADDMRKDKTSFDSSEFGKDSKDRPMKQRRDNSRDSRIRTHELKLESHGRTGSKERDNSESSHKQETSVPSAKESDSSEAFVIRDEAEDLDDYTMTESVDYDPISDGELEALIEDPEDSLCKSESADETKIVDALDVNWSVLMNDPKPAFIPGNARKRFKAVHVLSRIGFSKALAGPEISEKIAKFCQQQLDEEKAEEEKESDGIKKSEAEKKFQMEHDIAAFHVSLMERKRERHSAFTNIGPARRALCARQDLQIRKLLCQPTNKLVTPSSGACLQQCGNTDLEQELKKLEGLPIINATC